MVGTQYGRTRGGAFLDVSISSSGSWFWQVTPSWVFGRPDRRFENCSHLVAVFLRAMNSAGFGRIHKADITPFCIAQRSERFWGINFNTASSYQRLSVWCTRCLRAVKQNMSMWQCSLFWRMNCSPLCMQRQFNAFRMFLILWIT